MSQPIKLIGDENGYHITVARSFVDEGFDVIIWNRNHGTSGFGVVREQAKAEQLAEYLYEQLYPEFVYYKAESDRRFKEYMAEQAKKPKPKPPRVPKNAPKVKVLECDECNHLMLPDEVSDLKVYECNNCGTKQTADDGRNCEQCHKFMAKLSDTSCPECNAPMDDVETEKLAQKATNGQWIEVEE